MPFNISQIHQSPVLPALLVLHINIIVPIAPPHKISLVAIIKPNPETLSRQKYPINIIVNNVKIANELITNLRFYKKNTLL